LKTISSRKQQRNQTSLRKARPGKVKQSFSKTRGIVTNVDIKAENTSLVHLREKKMVNKVNNRETAKQQAGKMKDNPAKKKSQAGMEATKQKAGKKNAPAAEKKEQSKQQAGKMDGGAAKAQSGSKKLNKKQER